MRDFSGYVNIIKERLTPKRFEHSLRVAETAVEMAKNRELDSQQVYLAGLLHDYAKDLPYDQLLKLAKEEGLLTCQAEEIQPDLLHGPVGAYLLEVELGISDKALLQAIRYHTTGHVAMTELDIIIYLADLIEPGRKYDGIERLRQICQKDLQEGLLYAFDATLNYVLERKMMIHPLTVEARNSILPIAGKINKEEVNG